jgi:arylformamidase
MKIYDISQEIFSCDVYPGDPIPQKEILCSMESGALYNLSAFSMCNHNGTHVDAPLHFIRDGRTVDEIPLAHTVGKAYVAEHCGMMTGEDALKILAQANSVDRESVKRILIKGEAVVTNEAAQVFADAEILLLGNESQSVGPVEAPMAVHLTLLQKGIVLLEGIRLNEVPCGVYLLNAAPLCLRGAEGSPCRAILMDFKSDC